MVRLQMLGQGPLGVLVNSDVMATAGGSDVRVRKCFAQVSSN